MGKEKEELPYTVATYVDGMPQWNSQKTTVSDPSKSKI